MLNFKRAASLSICALVLTACGGNDGNNHHHDMVNHDDKKIDVQINYNDSGYSSGAYLIQKVDGEVESIKSKATTGKDLKNIVIDGQILDVSGMYGRNSGSFIETFYKEGRSYVGGINQLSYSRFGAYTFNKSPSIDTEKWIGFFIGEYTPVNSMPTTGVATYRGDAIYHHVDNTKDGWGRGQALFDVHYANKLVNGQIKFDENVIKNHLVNLSGKIHGNSFSGIQDGIEMKGSFFGPGAAEMSGVFYKKDVIVNGEYREKDAMLGAFGAKK